jgi:tight adherence protein C
MLILLATAFIFLAIVVLVIGLTQERAHPMTARIAGLRGEQPYDFDFRRADTNSAKSRLFGPLASSLGVSLQRVLPVNMVQSIRHRLIMAGEPTTVPGFLMGCAASIVVMVGFAVILLTSGSFGALAPVIAGFSLILGLVMPKVWLDNRTRMRQKMILRSLPDAFDLVTTCVEAGLGLEAALSRVAEKIEGPFAEELTVLLHDVSLGKLRREALRELAERTGVPDLTTFINAVIQAETMGTSIAAVLRVQADQMRIKRRQRAEQEAQAAPIKMMFPLVLFIFPTMFIVILGPAAISIYDQLVNKG